MVAEIDRERVEQLIRAQQESLAERLPRSIDFAKRASGSLAGGVACTWHALDPYTIYGARGDGATIWDLDGNAYVDLHCGYGVMVAGHAHPKVVESVRDRVGLGTHFAMPVEETVEVAELLAERFGLPLWRFKNSGTEVTMEAARIMRAATGRDLVIKVEGSYHGSSDGLAFSYWVDPDEAGLADAPRPVANTGGIPDVFGEALRIVPFNDAGAVERIVAEEGARVAGMILEPVLMNAGVIEPAPGYLEHLRDVLHRNGSLLAFDEVKTGVTIAAGGATDRYGVRPDLVALAKAIGGGIPVAAVGGSEEAMRVYLDGTLEGEGTFNGNPLGMAAAKVVLSEILTPDVYPRLEELAAGFADGLRNVIQRYELPATVASVGCRGSIHWRTGGVRNFRDAAAADDRLPHLAWLFQLTGGVFPPAGDPTTFSVAHTAEDLARSVERLEACAEAVTAGP